MHTQVTDQSVIVVRGGGNRHRPRSLQSGSSVYHALRKDTDTHDVHLRPDGSMTHKGKPIQKSDMLNSHATIFNALHGNHAGQMSRLCRQFNSSHTGNTHLHQAMYQRPHESRHTFRSAGINTIPHWTFTGDDGSPHSKLYRAILDEITLPVVIFPLPDNYSHDSLVVRSRSELTNILRRTLPEQSQIHAQQGVSGGVYSMIAMPEFRGTSPYVFPAYFRREADVANQPEEPLKTDYQPVSNSEQSALQNFARDAFASTDLSCLARIDVLKTADGDLFLSHIETHPDLSRHSLLAESVNRVGAVLADVFWQQVKTART